MVPAGKLTRAVPLAGLEAIFTEAGSMLPNTAVSLARTLMTTELPEVVDTASSPAIGGNILNTGVGLIAIKGGSAGQAPVAQGKRVELPSKLNLPLKALPLTYENTRSLALESWLWVY